MALSATEKAEIRAHWRAGQTSADVAALAEKYQTSPRTVWRTTRDLRARSARRDKRPHTVYAEAIGEKLLEWVVGLVDQGAALDDVIAAARHLGKEGVEHLSRYKVQRAFLGRGYRIREMRKRGEAKPDGSRAPMVRRAVERHTPNALHLYDETRAPSMYVDEADGCIVFDPLGNFDPQAAERGKTPLWVGGVLDDASRASHLVPILGSPCAEAVLDVLAEAWGEKPDPARQPFFGLPELLYSDNGSWVNSETVREACGLFGVKAAFHRPYQPWAKGKLERLFRSTNSFWALDRAMRTRVEETDAGGVRRRLLRMKGADVALFFKRLNFLLGWRTREALGEAPLDRWVRLVRERPETLRAAPPAEAWQQVKLAWIETRLDPLCTVRLPAGERVALDYGLFSGLVGREVKVGFRRRERGRPVAEGETVQVLYEGRRFESARLEWKPAGALDWRTQPRTPGEVLAERAARTDYSGDDLTAFAEASARQVDLGVRPAAFDLTRLSGKLGAEARRVSRLEAVDRLQAAGIFSRPMTVADKGREAAWFAFADVVDLDLVETILRTGAPPAAEGGAAAAAG